MINYCEYLNLYGLSFKIGFDRLADTETKEDFKLICAVDYCGDPVIYDYWGNLMSFVEVL